MVQTVPDVLYEIDHRGNFVFVSEAVRIFGYEPEKLTGKKFTSIMHPEDAKRVSREIILPKMKGRATGDVRAPKLFNERRTKRRMTRNMEVRLLSGPGKRQERDFFYVEVHASGVWTSLARAGSKSLEGTLGIFRDVTHRKFFEFELAHRYKDVLNVLMKNPDGMIVVNRNNEIVFVNPSAEKLYSKKAKDLVGTVFSEPDDGSGLIELQLPGTSRKKRVLGVMSIELQWEGEKCRLVSLRDETENIMLREMFCEASMRDELTELYNRRAFIVLASQQVKISKRKNEYLYILFADVDGLKKINDKYGHAEGDNLLREIADSMRAVFRESDILSRISGDEFAVMGAASKEQDVVVAKNRWKGHINFMNGEGKFPYEISLSIGEVCEVPSAQTGVSDLLDRADRKMYEEKKRLK